MSRFYGKASNGRGQPATKCGHSTVGLTVQANGWDIGAEVWAHADRTDPELDVVTVELTAGTNGAGDRLNLGSFVRDGRGHRCTGGRLADLLDAARAAELWCAQLAELPGHEAAANRMAAALRGALAAFGEGA
jgi:hypothetical protein